ncbi:uncharacterized protein BDR25DRAFT_291791 [Lindgomyces ingoldianus]|uniref:Uncharacterized protein n=1 Tax=Lindgomyces ingoldianus TaxID=673940 RepID=A0ACB6QKI7_9PLEO|nr:uncharacterized protein BDR25DRAFT_291791 [Lindgomyces ingoldianus]KAF2467415.1 hypothetical protein BDR25DRAFT_291791 [Lindgomyces ingoldianus]
MLEAPWPRRLIVCCDGTWQSSVSGSDNVPSNVTKLCRLINRIGDDQKKDSSKKWHQLVYYDGGIGTGALSNWEKTRQGGTGLGLAENVIEAYNFIVLNYQPGDEIFCFGFSRGAYTARAVAGLVTDIGVFEPRHMQIFPEVYRLYKSNKTGIAFRETDAWKNIVNGKKWDKSPSPSNEPNKSRAQLDAEKWEIPPRGELAIDGSNKVKVVGVWDTVGSLGIPDIAWIDNTSLRSKYAFHNVSLNENIEHAFHALALDEHRKAFRPTLWYISNKLKARLPADKLPELKQVWFPGVHINSGGGSDDSIGDMKGDKEQLANVTFSWMLQCIAPYLTIDDAEFKKTITQYQQWLDKVRWTCTYYHEGWFGKAVSILPNVPFVNPAPDELTAPRRDKPHQHPDLDRRWGTGPIDDSYTFKYKLNGSEPRVPGHCRTEFWYADPNNKDGGQWKLEYIKEHGDTNEYIHPVCAYRQMIRGPKEKSALGDFNRTLVKNGGDKGRHWWFHNDGDPIPEWVILEQDNPGFNFERSWYEECVKENREEGDWLLSLDKKNNFDIKEKAQPWFYPAPPKQ